MTNRLAVIRRRATVLSRTVGRYMPDDIAPGDEEPIESLVQSMKSDAVSGALALRRRTTGSK